MTKEFNYVKEMPEGLSLIQQYAWLDKAEKEATKAKDSIKKVAIKEVEANDKFAKTEFGNVQWQSRNTTSAKDSMKFFLQEKGYLEMCKKDDIDLSKVKNLIEAGMLNQEDVNEHITNNSSPFLKVK